jgi:hypothetical protein
MIGDRLDNDIRPARLQLENKALRDFSCRGISSTRPTQQWQN